MTVKQAKDDNRIERFNRPGMTVKQAKDDNRIERFNRCRNDG